MRRGGHKPQQEGTKLPFRAVAESKSHRLVDNTLVKKAHLDVFKITYRAAFESVRTLQ